MRTPLLLVFSLLTVLLVSPTYADDKAYTYHDNHGKDSYPDLISVPDGFQPEGVVRGRGHTAYVGSLKTGAIYEVDLVSGKGELLVESAENPAVGLAYDKRSNYLFVAGGPSGTVTVYDATDGQLKAIYTLAAAGGTFVNDGIVTRKAAYFTDSFAPVIYRLPLGKNGRLPQPEDVETISLSADFEFVPGGFNANGIESAHDGKVLYVVNSTTGLLYRVDPDTGDASQVTIANGDLVNGDGLLFYGHKLYVVQNFFNQIAEVKLMGKGTSATITRTLTNANFQIPTTATGFNGALYAINARFDVAPPPFFGNPPADPTLEYHLVRVELDD